jgi:ATP-dependent exoDNAse (exonuclease V) beta subunit
MNPIEIISASAGSGKTYKLASVLEEAVKGKKVRPQAIIATTFTVKAAAELRERVRLRLLEAGLSSEAQQLNAAIMGTVNSVCGRLVNDFAFYLGMSPELRVLDEEMAAKAMRRALYGVIDKEADTTLARLTESFRDWQVDELISRIVELARANGLNSARLTASRDRCISEIDELISPAFEPKKTAYFMKDLQFALQAFIAYFERGEDETAKTATCADKIRQFQTIILSGKTPPWQDWAALSNLDAAKKSVDAIAPVLSFATDHINLPQFRADLKAAVATVFDLAARALDSYAEYKKERGFIDFVDQECLALALLDMPKVQAHLKGDIDLVLVDEFQDTSPIQLAIFLKLADIAPRSVWVGDQKQSIYAFRGSDPELMNAAIDKILEGREPETLPKSWRSRPGLVRLTSDLFARAFPRHDIPASRVRLEPALTEEKEPAGLGPFTERWMPQTKGRSKDSRVAALASAIKECLEDRSFMVRDKVTGEPRPVQPKDIAILCRQNNTCVLVAQNLAKIGIKSAFARAGLMTTPEARLILSALRLWSDPNDALSAAEIARLLEYPNDPEGWLSALLEKPGPAAFKDLPVISRIKAASTIERSCLGVLAIFDRIVDLLPIRDICRRWGNADDRLANLNMLRSLAVRYSTLTSEEGAGMTPAGLSAFLTDLDDGVNDPQAFSPDAEAVIISTWHRAKGLEWPIVVLYELDADFSRPSLNIHVVSDQDKISLDDPLAERWIRYWPNPYHFRTRARFHELIQKHPAYLKAAEIERRESLRLLYVGWTRARDRVVLTCPEGKLEAGMLEELREEEQALLSEPKIGKALWSGHKIDVVSRAPWAADPTPVQPEAEPVYATEGPRDYPPAWGRPDLSAKKWEAAEPEILGDPIALRAQADMMNLGSAVHGFLAADSPEYPEADRLEMADGLIKRWGVDAALNPERLLAISDRLHKWADSRWPGAKWHREWHTFQRLEAGSIAHGVTDLFIETPDGLIIIDHKAYPGNVNEAKEFALGCAEQLQVYTEGVIYALNPANKKMFIHFPLIGVLVQLNILKSL